MAKRGNRTRRKAIDGIILLNKPQGSTSNAALQGVMRLLNAQKGGHTGALDPFATGLLPICLGEATKVSGLLLDSDKRYIATLKLGEATTTGDLEGERILQKPVPAFTQAQLQQIFQQFLGAGEQVPPMFSALKYQGKPLYEYARQGIEIERPARPIYIYELKLLSFEKDQITFEVLCSKGTYVRTLGEEIAQALKTVGHLIALHRTQAGQLTADKMLTLEEIEQAQANELLTSILHPLDVALTHYQAITLEDEQVAWIKQGGMLKLPKPETEYVRLYDSQANIIAIGEWHTKTQQLKAKRVFLCSTS